MSWISILMLLGLAQGTLLALVLLTRKSGAHIAHRYIGVLTLLFALTLFDTELFFGEKDRLFAVLLYPKEYFYGVLLYFYVREMTHPHTYFLRNKQWIHFLPALLHVVIVWSLLLLDSSRQDLILEGAAVSTMPDVLLAFLLGYFENITSAFHMGIYLFLSLRLLHQHRIHIQNTFSYSEKINLNWLRFLVLGAGFIYLVWVVPTILSNWMDLDGVFFALFDLFDLSMVVLIYSMGYLGLRRPEIFSPLVEKNLNEKTHPSLEINREISTTKDKKYKKSALSSDHSKLFMEELERLMQQEKLYLDNKLSLPQLAKKLDISVNYLSQTINEQKQQNFFDFINSYRIEDAKIRLAYSKNKKNTILTIAMDSGFNSKSSFYSAFRKHTGFTPGQYRKTLQVSS